MSNYSRKMIMPQLELTNFVAGITLSELTELCQQAQAGHFHSVMVNSGQVRFCVEQLEADGTTIGSYVSFPLGQMSIPSKAFEVEDAISNGAKEVAYLPNLTQLKAGDSVYFANEMGVVKEICATRDIISTLILEVSVLTAAELKMAVQQALKIAPTQIQICSGFGEDDNADLAPIKAIKELVQDELPIKVAIPSLTPSKLIDLLNLGVNSIVTSSIEAANQTLASFE